MSYGTSPGGLIVPERLADTSQVTATARAHYLSREFHPDNEASYARRPDPEYLKKLHAFAPEVRITWHPVLKLWQVWQPDPTMGSTIKETEYCKGWMLVFTIRDSKTKGYAPLDERLFALLYHHDSSRFGGAMGYYNELKRREDAQKARQEREQDHCSEQTGRDIFDHLRPSVGYGPSGDGNKVGKFG